MTLCEIRKIKNRERQKKYRDQPCHKAIIDRRKHRYTGKITLYYHGYLVFTRFYHGKIERTAILENMKRINLKGIEIIIKPTDLYKHETDTTHQPMATMGQRDRNASSYKT